MKVCGRRELFSLLKYRTKYQATIELQKKKAKQAKAKEMGANIQKELTPEELEEQTNKELEETIKRVEKERKR